MKIRIQNPESRSQNLISREAHDGTRGIIMNILSHNQVTKKPRLCILFVVFLCSFVSLLLKGATVLIPLQTCGISPATNRNVILTPLQAMGSNAVPVMDKIQGTTDGNGNWLPALMPGVYQAQVRPAWGQVGTTEFYFYVDPSNAVQSAYTNLLTGTNITWPPNQYAYSAQASDARYVTQTQYQGAISANEFVQNASANMRGILYYKTNWTSLSDFQIIADNSADFSINSGHLMLNTGDSFLNNYLVITNMIGNGVIDGENFAMTINFTMEGTPSGNYTFFIGRQSANPDWVINWVTSISSYGFYQLAKQGSSLNYTATDPSFTIANGNTVNITFQELGEKFSTIVQNVTSNTVSSFTITPGFTNNNPAPPPNTGFFCIHDTGVTPIQINSIKIVDFSPTNVPWAIVGDSVVEGEMSEFREYRFASILAKRLGVPCDVFSGDGDRTFDISNDLPYILSFHPQNVLLRIGHNDFTLANDWSSQSYSNIVAILTNAGINVYNLCAEPDNSGSYTTLNIFLLTNYPASTIPVFNWNATTMLGADGTHPNPLGYQCLADDVSAFLPQFASRFNQTEYHSFDQFQLYGAGGITANIDVALKTSGSETLDFTNGFLMATNFP